MTYNFYIDSESRRIKAEPMSVMWMDHRVQTIHFSAQDPEGFTFDGASILIKVILPNKEPVEITPENISIEEIVDTEDEEEVVTGHAVSFDWTLDQSITRYKGTVSYSICAVLLATGGTTVSQEWHSADDKFTVKDHIHFDGSDDQDDPDLQATNAEKIAALKNTVGRIDVKVNGLAGGAPPTADSTDDMDPGESTIYVNATDGHLYFWNGSDWRIGGIYGANIVDSTLEEDGVAANSRTVGEALADKADADDVDALDTRVIALESGSSGGLTADIKAALLACFAHVAWEGTDGQDYIDALDAALNPPANLTRITAVYTQSGDVYDNQTLDSLKPDLVVMAIYDNGTSETVTTYTLSGTLATGASTITVSYGGKTTTFTVTVTHATTQYTVTNTLTNCSNSNSATVANEDSTYSGALTADTDYVMGTVTITMGGSDITSTAYESGTGVISIASVTGDIVITAVATAPPITVNYTYPKTATWNPQTGTLSKAIGAKGTKYRIEVDVTSISAASAYVVAAVKGSGDAPFGNGQSMAGQTGTISWNHTVTAEQEVGATTFKISCNKGSESSNQTAVISDIRIYEV